MQPVLRLLEPFALDLWRTEIEEIVPDEGSSVRIEKTTYFGGLYQKDIAPSAMITASFPLWDVDIFGEAELRGLI